MATLLEKFQEIVDDEVKKQLMKYAHIISNKHDISLKLLLQDISLMSEDQTDVGPKKSGQCLGITAKRTQCKTSGKNDGYCMRHITQKKEKPRITNAVTTDKNPHVGHTMKECMFLAGCPACEKARGSQQNLLIDF